MIAISNPVGMGEKLAQRLLTLNADVYLYPTGETSTRLPMMRHRLRESILSVPDNIFYPPEMATLSLLKTMSIVEVPTNE